MEVDFKVDSGVGIVRISGRLDASNADDFKSKFEGYLVDANNFVFDVSEMEFIDSTGLGGVVTCLKRTADKSGNVKIACLAPKPRMVFEITRAYKIFDIYDDVAAAVASYR